MATKYLKSAGGTYSASATWSATGSGGVDNAGTPTAADELILQVGSGQLTISGAAVCRSFNASAYTNTITHGAFSLTIGDGTAPTGGVAFVLNTACTYTPNASSSIVFTSSAAGVHTINTGGKTIQAITFNNTGSYQFVTSNVTVTGNISHTNGTIDFNGLSFTFGGQFGSTGANARTLTLGSSIITVTASPSAFALSGSNLTFSNNTATFVFSGASPNINSIDTLNYNGTSFKFIGAAGTVTWSNTCTIQNLIIDPTTTRTLVITSGKTVTLDGLMYCDPQGGVVTITGGTISKASGIVNLYQIASNTCTFTGGATWNLMNNCDALPTLGLTKLGGDFYLDLVNGSDAIYNAYGFYKVAYTGATGTCPIIGETMTGGTSSKTAIITHVNPYDWSVGAGTLFFKSKSGTFVAETLTGGTGGGTCSIAADLINSAWLTPTSGATAARIAPGDTINTAKTSDPSSIGNAVWTNCQTNGGFPATKAVTATANNGSGLIRITVGAGHGYAQDDVIQMISVGGTLEANGAWLINYISSTQFDLVDSTFVNAWTSGGTTQKINSKAVVLASALTIEVNRCKSNWSNGVDGTSTLLTTDHKEGGACIKVTMDSATNANSKQAYQAITIAGATANNYQVLSFWFKNSAAIADATTWYVGLCSDALGATVIDTFPIPAIASTARWVCLLVVRSGGGNLGGNASTAIASVAVWSGATAPTNSCNIQIDNIIACTTGGLSMISLISKNGSAQGGTEGYYGIQSINHRVVLLDNDTNTLSNAGRGYSTTGTTPETVTTYIRDSFRTPVLASASSTAIHTINDSGIFGYPIIWSFGWNIVNGTCDGETYFDGGNGLGRGIYVSQKNYLTFSSLNTFRFDSGSYFTGPNTYLINITNYNNSCNNSNYGVYIVSTNNCNLYISNLNNNTANGGLYINNDSNIIITNAGGINNNTTWGSYCISSTNNILFYNITALNNGTYGVANTAVGVTYSTLYTNNNSTAGIHNDIGLNFVRNGTINESTPVAAMILGSAAELRSIKEDGVEGNNWTYFYGATSNWQTSEKQGSDPGSWKIILTNAARLSNYPIKIKIEGIECAANKLVTIIANVKKDHATDIINQLHVYADTVRGIGTVSPVQGTATTSWETITLTFTPTNVCIAEVFYEVYSAAGNLSNAYLGSISITQAP